MEPITIGARTIPIATPDRLDIVGLLEAFVSSTRKPAALIRLRLAAIGLGWWAAYDALPDRTPADKAERAGSRPPFGRLEEMECDLLAFGRRVGQALGDDAVEARVAGDRIAAEWFQLVIPSEVQRSVARGNSEGRGVDGGATSSASAPSITATPSPASI
jgi:hypothetical protein